MFDHRNNCHMIVYVLNQRRYEVNKMRYTLERLDAQLAEAAAQMPPVDNSDVMRAREMVAMVPNFRPPVDTEGLEIEEREIDGPDGHKLTLRIYRPSETTQPLPVLLFFHWGASSWVIWRPNTRAAP